MRPIWLVYAEGFLGQREVPGPGASAWIRSMWLGLRGGSWFWTSIGKGDDSKLPWCGAFVAHCLQNCHMAHAQRYASAKAWLEWGTKLTGPALGCVVVFEREGGGHVGFVYGRDTKGRLLVLGGNQGDAVNVAPFDLKRVAGYLWPEDAAVQPDVGLPTLPLYQSGDPASANEA